jgi:hypothetical protein
MKAAIGKMLGDNLSVLDLSKYFDVTQEQFEVLGNALACMCKKPSEGSFGLCSVTFRRSSFSFIGSSYLNLLLAASGAVHHYVVFGTSRIRLLDHLQVWFQ